MLVGPDGECTGTIGGGSVEKEVTEIAAQVARGELAGQRVVRHLTRDLAMCCGGSMEFWIDSIDGHREVFAEVLRRQAASESSLVVTELSSGDKRVESPGGSGRSKIDGEHFYERIDGRKRAVLFGLGHVTRALAPLARSVGFEIVVCDDNETSQLEAAPSFADQVVASFDARDVEAQIRGFTRRDYVLILTRDHAEDERILGQLLPRAHELGYLGMIGSRGKVGRFRKRLFARGIATEDNWSLLHAPIGFNICAETPEEIAVSVVAELIAIRNKPEAT